MTSIHGTEEKKLSAEEILKMSGVKSTPEGEDRALNALIAMALHPRSKEISAWVASKMEEFDADVVRLHEAGWTIQRINPPIPARCGMDWQYVHRDYDGAPDSNDNRCGNAASLFACIEEIKDIEAAVKLEMPK